jgi:hypothetical protein
MENRRSPERWCITIRIARQWSFGVGSGSVGVMLVWRGRDRRGLRRGRKHQEERANGEQPRHGTAVVNTIRRRWCDGYTFVDRTLMERD